MCLVYQPADYLGYPSLTHTHMTLRVLHVVYFSFFSDVNPMRFGEFTMLFVQVEINLFVLALHPVCAGFVSRLLGDREDHLSLEILHL